MNTKMCCTDNGNKHLSIDITANLRVRFPHFSVSIKASLFRTVSLHFFAKETIRLYHKRRKCHPCSRQGSKYFFFFSCLWVANTLSDFLYLLDFASRYVILTTSRIQSISFVQRPQNQSVTSVFTAVIVKEVFDCQFLLSFG
jgi:hypothetical protein